MAPPFPVGEAGDELAAGEGMAAHHAVERAERLARRVEFALGHVLPLAAFGAAGRAHAGREGTGRFAGFGPEWGGGGHGRRVLVT